MNNDLSSNADVDSQTLLNQIVIDYLKEKKRRQRWRWISRTIIVLLMVFSFFSLFYYQRDSAKNVLPHVGLIDLNGEIADGKINADDFAKGMDSAYKSKGLKALIIRINSPGGSPVQAEYIYNTVLRYKKKYPDIKTYAVCVDLCASAAYYIAAATDEIYASPASLVGSIGVLYSGFGFVDTMDKLGVTRRLQTAGVNKGFMDPFSPITDDQKQKLQVMLDTIHQQFIERVKAGRGARLHITADTFSGLFWTGEQSLTMGLIDGIASSGQLARETIGVEKIIDYTNKQNLIDLVSKNFGASMAEQFILSLGLKPGIH